MGTNDIGLWKSNLRIKGVPLARVGRLLWPRFVSTDDDLRVFFCICDHFEPKWKRPPRSVEKARVKRWVEGYPRAVAGLRDSRGRPPQHTFFIPADEYEPSDADEVASLCRQGFGDVEVHLHHDGDTSESLREQLESFIEALHYHHGLLRTDHRGRIRYGFIHGNWALDNSRPDGKHCGVNDEISVLLKTGCYADFTLPSAPSPCQTETINSIYYATDDPNSPRSHDRGIPARAGRMPPDNALLMVQGPLLFDWSNRKWGVLPRIENGDLRPNRPPTLDRFHLWRSADVCVEGRENWIFVKLHTHGAQEDTTEMFLGSPMRRFHESLRELADSRQGFKYYYVTAYELAGLVHQAECGIDHPRFGVNPPSMPVKSAAASQVPSGAPGSLHVSGKDRSVCVLETKLAHHGEFRQVVCCLCHSKWTEQFLGIRLHADQRSVGSMCPRCLAQTPLDAAKWIAAYGKTLTGTLAELGDSLRKREDVVTMDDLVARIITAKQSTARLRRAAALLQRGSVGLHEASEQIRRSLRQVQQETSQLISDSERIMKTSPGDDSLAAYVDHESNRMADLLVVARSLSKMDRWPTSLEAVMAEERSVVAARFTRALTGSEIEQLVDKRYQAFVGRPI